MTHVGHDSRSSSKPGQGQPAVGANLIPATLDLAERARLAVNAMTEATNPEEDYRVYWKVTFRSNPPIMYHDFSDTGIAAKFMESLPRLRMMSGSRQGNHVEERWKELLPERIGPEGLVLTKVDDRLSPSRPSSLLGVRDGDSIIDMQVNGLMLGAVTTYAVMESKEFLGADWQTNCGRSIRFGRPRRFTRILHRLDLFAGSEGCVRRSTATRYPSRFWNMAGPKTHQLL